MRNALARLAVLALVLSPLAATAHEGHDHITGSVTKVQADSIEVKAADGTSHEVALTKATVYTTRFDPEATFAEFRHADVRVCREHRGPAMRRPAHRAAPVLPRFAGLTGRPGLPHIPPPRHSDAGDGRHSL